MTGFRHMEKGKVFSMKEMIGYKKHRIISSMLCDTESMRMVLFSFDEQEAITKEQTPNTEQFTLLEGKMEVVVGDSTFMLGVNDTIIVHPEEEHSLLALEPCKMLQTSLK